MSAQSTVKFKTPDGVEFIRQALTSTSDIIAQATEEFGEIEVLESKEGDAIENPENIQLEALVHTLQAARQNIDVVLDQLKSAETVRELPEVVKQLQEAGQAIDDELKDLNG